MDTIELVISVKHTQFAGQLLKKAKDGKTKPTNRSDRKAVWNSRKTGYLHVRSLEQGTKLLIEGSLAKFYYGHNIYGPAYSINTIVKVVLSVLRRLKISPTEDEIANMLNGEIQVNRIDFAANIICESEDEVPEVMKAISCHLNATQANFSRYEYNTVYADQHSRSKTIKFYNKKAELNASPRAKARFIESVQRSIDPEKCIKHIDNLIRVEATYRSRFLKSRNLNYLKNWNEDTPYNLFIEDYKNLKLSGDFTIPIYATLKSINKTAYRQTLIAYIHGLPIKEIIDNRQTYANHRKYFKEHHNIDIDIPLATLVDRKRIEPYTDITALRFKRPEYFLPSKKK